jgi:DNA repair exonuclease SbcCD ATPase subunit
MQDIILTVAQAKEILEWIDKANLTEAFKKIDAFCGTHHSISVFKQDYISGLFRGDFIDRLKVCVCSLAPPIPETEILPAPTQYELFFSFSSQNKTEADALVKELRQCNVNVFYSGDDLKQHAGKNFGKIIEQALEHSQHFLLYCTPEAIQSHYVDLEWRTFQQEIHLSNKEARRLFVLKPEKHPKNIVPMLLRQAQFVMDLGEILSVLGKTNPHEQIIKDLQADKTRLQTELNESNIELARLQARNETLSRQEKQAKVALEAEQEKIHELEARLQQPSKGSVELQKEIERLKEELYNKESIITEQAQTLKEKQEAFDALQARSERYANNLKSVRIGLGRVKSMEDLEALKKQQRKDLNKYLLYRAQSMRLSSENSYSENLRIMMEDYNKNSIGEAERYFTQVEGIDLHILFYEDLHLA